MQNHKESISKKGGIPTKIIKSIFVSLFFLFSWNGAAAASGLFGPPQSVSNEAGGLNTAIGYKYHADKYENGSDYLFRQKQVFSHLGYGTRNWEIYGRIGIADLKMSDAFRSAQAATAISKNDFDDRWKIFGTLGTKGFCPLNKTFGLGAFVQGSYFFQDFKDHAAGTRNGAPFTAEVKLKDLWDVNFGVAFQATVPKNIRLYVGPYIYYSEAKISPTPNIPGLEFSAGDVRINNKTAAGGFAGIDIPILKGFHLNIEGQFSERFSAGAAISFSY